jgi:hypothetical protein
MLYQNLLKFKDFYQKLKKKYFSIVITKDKAEYYKNRKIVSLEMNLFGFIHNFIKSVWYLIFLSIIAHDVWSLYLIFLLVVFSTLFSFQLLNKKFVGIILSFTAFYLDSGHDFINKILTYLFFVFVFLGYIFHINIFPIIRVIFFLRCIFPFIIFTYKLFPGLQKYIIDYNILQEEKLMEILHGKIIPFNDLLKQKILTGELDEDKGKDLLNRYDTFTKTNVLTEEAFADFEKEYDTLIKEKSIIDAYNNLKKNK